MQPLIVTAACGQPDTTANVINSVVQAWRAGAAIAQIRAPSTHHPVTGRPQTDLKVWTQLITGIREKCDILIHAGTAAMQVEDRIEMLETLHPDTASFLLGHHALFNRGVERNSLRSRDDSLKLMQGHIATGVLPEFEVFHSGSLRNLEFLMSKVALPRPAVTMFFGWDGGDWSPCSVEEMLHRVRLLPENALYTITAAGPEHMLLHALAIARGGHVRGGPGDYAFYRDGVPWRDSAQFVESAKRLADEFGREVATPARAADILGIKRR